MHHLTVPVNNHPTLQSHIVTFFQFSLSIWRRQKYNYTTVKIRSLLTHLKIQLVNLLLNISQYHKFQTATNHHQSVLPATRYQIAFRNSLINLIHITTNIVPTYLHLIYQYVLVLRIYHNNTPQYLLNCYQQSSCTRCKEYLVNTWLAYPLINPHVFLIP